MFSSQTGSIKKKQCVLSSEDYHQQQKKKGKNKKDSCVGVVSNLNQLDSVMKSQKQKDKQHLQEWKRNRATDKRTQRVLLLQSRKVKDLNKMTSVKVFDEYEEHEGTCILKHECQFKDNPYDCEDCFYRSTPIYSM